MFAQGTIKRVLPVLMGMVCCTLASGQTLVEYSFSGRSGGDGSIPVVGIKTNVLYDATSSINLGVEVNLTENMTLDIAGNYNPWTFSDGRKFRHWLIQPEYRYWLRRSFDGHFFGTHVFFADYNVAGIKMLGTEHTRHQGNLYGLGVSYGYQWQLGNHWNFEATIGIGYARLKYDQYDCKNCKISTAEHKNYFGPTKAGISIIYLIK